MKWKWKRRLNLKCWRPHWLWFSICIKYVFPPNLQVVEDKRAPRGKKRETSPTCSSDIFQNGLVMISWAEYILFFIESIHSQGKYSNRHKQLLAHVPSCKSLVYISEQWVDQPVVTGLPPGLGLFLVTCWNSLVTLSGPVGLCSTHCC